MGSSGQEENSAIPEVLETKAFRGRLREAIRLSGLTQKRVAETLRVREATVSDWLTGEGTANLPSGEALLRLAGILKVNHHWLWRDEGDPRARPGDADILLKEMRRLANEPAAAADEIREREAARDAAGEGEKSADAAPTVLPKAQ